MCHRNCPQFFTAVILDHMTNDVTVMRSQHLMVTARRFTVIIEEKLLLKLLSFFGYGQTEAGELNDVVSISVTLWLFLLKSRILNPVCNECRAGEVG